MARNQDAETTRHTIVPGMATQITLQTRPYGVCTLHKDGDDDLARSARLYADPEGIVRFHARPSALSEEVANVVIDCEVDGTVTSHRLELRPHHTPTPEMPFPAAVTPRQRPPAAKVRPALSEDELWQLPEEELLARGYPLRPHHEEAPHAFRSWRRMVSTSVEVVEPHIVTRPDISHGRVAATGGPASSNNWSGFELRGGTYDWVSGIWTVPDVTGESNSHTYSTVWVGLDGDGTSDLVQAGTEMENFDLDFLFFHISFGIYYAWTEFLPQQPTEQQITNFPVNPGDQIFAEVWVGNAGSGPTLTGFFGVFFLENMTRGTSSGFMYTPRGTTIVGGTEAEWIMERPTVNGSLPDLADYHSAVMSSAYARRTNSGRHQGYVPYSGAANRQITMFNSADILSTVQPIDATSMRFNWQRFN